MKQKDDAQRAKSWGRTLRLGALGLLALVVTAPACLNRPVQPGDVHRTGTVLEKVTQSAVNKIDILLAIDNSRSMSDKQKILNKAVPDLVQRLVNPYCLDTTTNAPITAGQPASPTDPCPSGSKREFQPILDIHIGVVSSSLGGHGSNACPEVDPDEKDCPNGITGNDDHGHLITRADQCKTTQVPTYGENHDLGFLAWDPKQTDMPAGEADPVALQTNLTSLVTGTGQIGCGFESQEEGWLRFLVDPSPYQSIALSTPAAGGTPLAVKQGTDPDLLTQRADFLRPDSLLAIVVLTDENDGSAIEGGLAYIVEESGHLPPARTECATNPLDPCCRACWQDQTGCAPEAICATTDSPPPTHFVTLLDDTSDNINERMFDNKRRFGADFLYPWQRYVNALKLPMINPASLDLAPTGVGDVQNPIFSDLQKKGGTIRDPSLVFLAGIVGVPWQDIAVDPTDLTQGFKTSKQLGDIVPAAGASGWDIILGDPDNYTPPLDPHMIEQINPRTTTMPDPITGTSLAPPQTGKGPDPINGHEYHPDQPGGDLQYACIFDLPQATDCTTDPTCNDCKSPTNDNPLCDPDPAKNNQPTMRARAKAYPGIRHLQILKGLGDQGIVASVCPKQVTDTMRSDYGYRPAVSAIIARLSAKLVTSQCLPRSLTPDASKQVGCVMIEAKTITGGVCCDAAKGRSPVELDHLPAQAAAETDKTNPVANPWNCFCEIPQTKGADLDACQNTIDDAPQVGGQAVNGWCYIDATTVPATGNPALVAPPKCDKNDQREIRFVGNATGSQATIFVNCSDSSN